MMRMPRSASSLRTCTTILVLTASRALVGSSRKRRRGNVTSSMPMPTRRICPPESLSLVRFLSQTKSRHLVSPKSWRDELMTLSRWAALVVLSRRSIAE
mmetsp:Transcript_29593/g.59520  ORF Transcript_29593/g.59520 Transcript_29593/m.59520 type:complete len:99 (+) Transcript_29593:162-458(+)